MCISRKTHPYYLEYLYTPFSEHLPNTPIKQTIYQIDIRTWLGRLSPYY